MSVTDLIADQLTVIRNAVRVGKKSVIVKRSNIIEGILEIIKKEGFIDNYKEIVDTKHRQIKVYLKYLDDGTPVLEELKRISKCGLREYVPVKKIKSVMGGVGISIFSTSKGLLTGEEAKSQGVGGELVCQIW